MAEYNDWRPEESLTDAPCRGRDHGLDNVRFGLMFLVVFGHFLEIMPPFAGKQLLYQVIYSFHMPAFLFLAGCNARFRPRQILLRWGLPYLIFDGVYVLFARLVLKADAVFDPARPYWLLWYLPACIFYQLLLPLYDRKSRRVRWAVLAGCFVLALGAGFADQVGYYLTASRFFVFQPWFVLGYYWKNSGRMANPGKGTLLTAALAVCLSVPFLHRAGIPDRILQGAWSYALAGGALWMRAAVYGISGAWIILRFGGFRRLFSGEIPLITQIGRHTWPVFLLHGLIVRGIGAHCPGLAATPVRALALTCLVLTALGNPAAHALVDGLTLRRPEKGN